MPDTVALGSGRMSTVAYVRLAPGVMTIVFGLFEMAKLKGESDDVAKDVVLAELIEVDEPEVVATALEDVELLDRMVERPVVEPSPIDG